MKYPSVILLLLSSFTLSSCKKDPEPIPEEKVNLFVRSDGTTPNRFSVTVADQSLSKNNVAASGVSVEAVKGKTIHYEGHGVQEVDTWLLIYNVTDSVTLFYDTIEFKAGAMNPSGVITIN